MFASPCGPLTWCWIGLLFLWLAPGVPGLAQSPGGPDSLTLDDLRSLYLQNRERLQPLFVDWTVKHTTYDYPWLDIPRRGRSVPKRKTVAEQRTVRMMFWTDGASFRIEFASKNGHKAGLIDLVAYDATRKTVITQRSHSGRRFVSLRSQLRDLSTWAFPPLAPAEAWSHLDVHQFCWYYDRILVQAKRLRHVCQKPCGGQGVHLFQLIGDPIPLRSFLLPDEAEQYGKDVEGFDAWLVEVDLSAGALPRRIWVSLYVTYRGRPLPHRFPGPPPYDPDVEVYEVQPVVNGAFYPVRGIVRRLTPDRSGHWVRKPFSEWAKGWWTSGDLATLWTQEWSVGAIEPGVELPEGFFGRYSPQAQVWDETGRSSTVASSSAAGTVAPTAPVFQHTPRTWLWLFAGGVLLGLVAFGAAGLYRRRMRHRSP